MSCSSAARKSRQGTLTYGLRYDAQALAAAFERRAHARVTPDAGLARVGLTLESGLGDRLLAAPLAAGTDVVFDVDAVAIASAYCLTIEGRCRSSAGHASACD